MRVICKRIGVSQILVTAQASFHFYGVDGQLIVRPFRATASIVRMMQRMARKARHFATLMAGTSNHAGELASGNTWHAIRPESILHEVGLIFQELLDIGGLWLIGTEHVTMTRQFLTGDKRPPGPQELLVCR